MFKSWFGLLVTGYDNEDMRLERRGSPSVLGVELPVRIESGRESEQSREEIQGLGILSTWIALAGRIERQYSRWVGEGLMDQH